MISSTLTWYALAIALLGAATMKYAVSREHRRYPPGPKGLPLVGNILGVPKLEPWKVYQDWSRKFDSDIVHFKLMGAHIVVLNSADVARELLERRAAVYSGRQMSVMLHELTGWWRNIGLMQYGEAWRSHRKMLYQELTPKAIVPYRPVMTSGVRRLLYSLHDAPGRFAYHIRFTIGSAMLKLVYDIDVQDEDDRNLVAVEKAVHVIALVANAGSYLVDMLPALKYMPRWFPGTHFKQQAAEWKHAVDAMFLGTFRELKGALDKGEVRPCITSTMIAKYSQEHHNEEIEQTIINSAGTAYAAAVDTTVTTLITFFQVMLQFPGAQRKAQDELDSILNRTRLPEIEDRESLPYVTALVKEVFRWHPALPLGIVHKSTADDIYEEYYLPAGTLCIPNAWAILHDERRYPNPTTFDPTRFLTTEGKLNPEVPDPRELFGLGRRTCLGRYFAQDITWLAIANILAVFTIEKPRDAAGNIIQPSGEYESAAISPPKPFKASINPRFAEAAILIQSSALESADQ